MNEKHKILRELDAAIDEINLDGIDRNLTRLTALEPHKIEAENVKLFAARIKQIDKERSYKMKNGKTMRIVLVAAAILTVTSIGVYASGVLNRFTFADGDRITTVQTTESMTEADAHKLVEDASFDSTEGASEAESEDYTFETVEEAEIKLDTKIAVPAKMPELELTEMSGQSVKWGDGMESRTVWALYGSADSKAVGITVEKRVVKPDSEFTSISIGDMDENSMGEYKSKSGKIYSLYSESDESGERTARIARTVIGNYEYALVFVGFEEAEMHDIIDSADLSVYN